MRQIPELSGLRGLAAYSVLLAHSLNFSGFTYSPLTALAYFGMSLFFILSGFVIHYNYGASFASEGIVAGSRRFLIARFARLYPLYFVILILSVSFVPAPLALDKPWIGVACLTLTQTWFDVHKSTGDVAIQSWSISTEVFFYLLFIPIASRMASIRNPGAWLVALCVAAPIVVVALARSIANSTVTAPLAGESLSHWFLYLSPFTRCFEFFAGVLAAQLVMRPGRWFRGDARRAAWTIGGCITWCLLLILFGMHIDSGPVKALMPNFIFAPAIVCALLALCTSNTFWSRLAASRLAVRAGDISYSVYMLQMLVFVALANSFVDNTGFSDWLRSIYIIFITTALAYGVFHLFEAPMRKWIRQLASAAATATVVEIPVSVTEPR